MIFASRFASVFASVFVFSRTNHIVPFILSGKIGFVGGYKSLESSIGHHNKCINRANLTKYSISISNMYYVVYLVRFKRNIIVPQNWILRIQDHWEKFINNGLNKNQKFVCFWTDNQMAFDENGTPLENFEPNFDASLCDVFPGEGFYIVNLRAFRGNCLLISSLFDA